METTKSSLNYDYFKNLIHNSLLNEAAFYSDETEEKENRIMAKINSQIYLDEKFKLSLENEIYELISDVDNESFDKGLDVAFAFIKSILTFEPNVLEVKVRTPKPLPKQEPIEAVNQNLDDEFFAFLQRAVPKLSRRNKMGLQGRIETLIELQNKKVI